MTRSTTLLNVALAGVCLCAGFEARSAGNVALGKRVTSNVAESAGYARGAARLTDGNPKSDAYPAAFSFDYTVHLTIHDEGGAKTDTAGFDIDSLVMDWGHYGRHFPGEKRPDGSWAPAAYKADYVNWYQVDYAIGAGDEWLKLHECKGRPTDEDAERVKVERTPATASSSEGEVRTTLKNLGLRNVSRIRVRARGGHWIGIYELSAMGRPSEAAKRDDR